jgi:hypothetical protein
MSAPRRAGLAALAALVFAALVVGALKAESPGASGDRIGASADDAGPGGLASWAALLRAADHSVERQDETPADAELDPQATTVLIDPGHLTSGDLDALRELVEAGGHLVVGGDVTATALRELADTPIELDGGGSSSTARPLVAAPEVDGVVEVEAGGGNAIARAGGALPLLAEGGEGALAALATPGDGRLVVVADSTPLENERIGAADNAQFALNVAGAPARPVHFVERVRSEPGTGLSTLPVTWLWVFGGLLLAGLCLIAARVRRLGPPEQATRPLPPPRRAYVDAIAAQLARVGDRDGAALILAKLRDNRPEVDR